jgi:hypothetical protein
MSAVENAWALLTQNAPALPHAWVMQLGLTLGWALVLATLGAALASKLSVVSRRMLAALLALWALLPGPLSPTYWLGLAFQAPSLVAMLLCGGYLHRLLWTRSAPEATAPAPTNFWLVSAVLLGYVLLLDSFAVLPLQIYAWGFSPLLLLALLALSLWPWVGGGRADPATQLVRWLLPAALLLFAVTRLPSGNLWDALLDPWLWLLLHGLWLRRLYQRWRA